MRYHSDDSYILRGPFDLEGGWGRGAGLCALFGDQIWISPFWSKMRMIWTGPLKSIDFFLRCAWGNKRNNSGLKLSQLIKRFCVLYWRELKPVSVTAPPLIPWGTSPRSWVTLPPPSPSGRGYDRQRYGLRRFSILVRSNVERLRGSGVYNKSSFWKRFNWNVTEILNRGFIYFRSPLGGVQYKIHILFPNAESGVEQRGSIICNTS